jgi:drug/metabolite transporter (DMT)-like permease
MSAEIVALALFAAALHAAWNTLIKISGDRVAVMAMVTLVGSLISTFLLKEGFGVWRFISAGLVALGLMLNRGQR